MERTELRREFFAEARADPWTHMFLHHVANAWAMGYEQALRDHGLDDARLEQRHSDRFEMALEWLTDSRREAQAQALIAMGAIGKLLPDRPPGV